MVPEDVTRTSRRHEHPPTFHETEMENPSSIETKYSLRRRLAYLAIALVIGVAVAGFWNPRAVDGFGRDVVAGETIGDPTEVAKESRGVTFGLLFAGIAGLAATFTACNCVVFAMLPGMACATDKASSRRSALKALGVMIGASLLVTALYGAFIGFIGPEGLEKFNDGTVRRGKAFIVFGGIGVTMIGWALIELGFLNGLTRRFSPVTRAFFSQPATKAAIMGVMIGLFTVGRPFGVFRAFEDYMVAAVDGNLRVLYGAVAMAVQGVGQVLVMALLFLVLIKVLGDRIVKWVRTKPHQPAMVSAIALATGGMYFLFYWGIARLWAIGGWGRKLGLAWYG